MIRRSAPSTIFSSASVKSASCTCSWPRRAAISAASLTRLRRSAPTIPGVLAAIALEVDVVGQRHAAGVHLEDLPAAGLVGRVDRHAAVEAARAQQRRVEDLGAVGRGDHDHALRCPVKPSISVRIWLRVCSRSSWPPPRRPPPPRERPIASSSSMKMIAGAACLGLREQVAHAARADADDRLDELRRRDREERHAGLAGDRPRQQRLARCRAGPRAARRCGTRRAEARVALGVAQEVDDLDQLVLGLVDPGHVVERRPAPWSRRRRSAAPASGRSRPARPPAAALRPAREQHEQPDEQERRPEPEQERLPAAAGPRRSGGR